MISKYNKIWLPHWGWLSISQQGCLTMSVSLWKLLYLILSLNHPQITCTSSYFEEPFRILKLCLRNPKSQFSCLVFGSNRKVWWQCMNKLLYSPLIPRQFAKLSKCRRANLAGGKYFIYTKIFQELSETFFYWFKIGVYYIIINLKIKRYLPLHMSKKMK